MSSDEIKAKFGGKWKVYKNENFDEFLKDIGLNFVMRKAAANGSPTHVITVDGDNIKIDIDAGIKKMEECLKLNTEVARKGERGNEVKTMTTYADGILTMVNTPVDTKEKPMTLTREIVGEDLVLTMSRGDVVAKRIFKKV